jgi:uncharacterized membrane protein YvbJ
MGEDDEDKVCKKCGSNFDTDEELENHSEEDH